MGTCHHGINIYLPIYEEKEVKPKKLSILFPFAQTIELHI